MKKALKAELTSLALQILQMNSTKDISKLKELTGKIHDKLTILEFIESHFEGSQPTITKKEIKAALAESDVKISKETTTKIIENTEKLDSKTQEVREASQPEIDKIEAPEKLEQPKTLSADEQDYNDRQIRLEALEAKNYLKNDMAHIGGVSYDDLPEFERVPTTEQPKKPKQEPEAVQESRKTLNTSKGSTKKSKSLNDLNRGIKIGLNDRLVFIKHLFDGSAGDYNRVLSQLNTIETKEKATNFLESVVKPDYKNWQGKELYEERFKEIIVKKFS